MCWPPKIGVFDSLAVLWFLAELFGNHDVLHLRWIDCFRGFGEGLAL